MVSSWNTIIPLLQNYTNKLLVYLLVQIVPHLPTQFPPNPAVSHLFLFLYEQVLMLCLSHENQANIIEAFNLLSRYLDDTKY